MPYKDNDKRRIYSREYQRKRRSDPDIKNRERLLAKQRYTPNKGRSRYLKDKEKSLSFLNSLKENKKCVICQKTYHPRCLDFHHIEESEKEFSISTKYRYNKGKLIKEIEKCIILCGNCHKMVTHGFISIIRNRRR